jgi:hypothetical protein
VGPAVGTEAACSQSAAAHVVSIRVREAHVCVYSVDAAIAKKMQGISATHLCQEWGTALLDGGKVEVRWW